MYRFLCLNLFFKRQKGHSNKLSTDVSQEKVLLGKGYLSAVIKIYITNYNHKHSKKNVIALMYYNNGYIRLLCNQELIKGIDIPVIKWTFC